MVESNLQIDMLFTALSDSTRRSILRRVAKVEMSIGEIADHYKLTFAAISKHIQVLEKAGLVTKRRRGKEQIVIIVPSTFDVAREHLEQYAKLWVDRYDKLEILLNKEDT
jgi:DNA-binding transcriptional ArsR family regulator